MTPSKDCLVYCRDHNFKVGGGGSSSGNSCRFSLVRLDFTGSYEGVQKGHLLVDSSLNASRRVSVVSSNY